MQKISFGGAEYHKASEVAKKFRYSQDYVGQLCRTGKVAARRVGRNWYVDIASVQAYRKTKHTTQKATKVAAQHPVAKKPTTAETNVVVESSNKKTSPRSVEPVVRTKTLRVAADARRTKKHQTSDRNEIRISTPASPQANRLQTNTQVRQVAGVRITPQPAVTLAVASKQRTNTDFVSEKLPEISLSGNVFVDDTIEVKTDDTVSVKSKKGGKTRTVTNDELHDDRSVSVSKPSETTRAQTNINNQLTTVSKNLQNKPQHKHKVQSDTIVVPTRSKRSTSRQTHWSIPLLVSVGVAVVFSMALLGAEQRIYTQAELIDGIKIDFTNVLELDKIFK